MEPALIEAQIKADVEKLALEFPQTQDLYREVASLLFFRYGITPTGNKLYQLVHRGSMSAPATALDRFWENLRSKCKVTIDTPDLPAELAATAGELVLTLWRKAQVLARDNFSEFRIEAEATIQKLESELAQQADTARQLRIDLEDSHRSWGTAQERGEQLAEELSRERSIRSALAVQVEDLGNQVASLETIIADSRKAYSAELEAARQSILAAEERCKAIETSGHMEVERERGINLKLQKEIESLRAAALVVGEEHRQAISTIESKLGETQKGLAVADGLLGQFRLDNQALVARTESLRSDITEREIKIGLLSHDLNRKDKELAEALKEIETLRRRKSTSESPRRNSH